MNSRILNKWIDFIRDHTYVITLLISGSMVGLMVIQLYLITAEIEMHHRQFDKNIGKVLLDMHHRIEDDETLSNQLISLFDHRVEPASINDSLHKELVLQIRELTDSTLIVHNMANLKYDFAFYHTKKDSLVLGSSAPSVQADFKPYSIKAGWRIKEAVGKGIYRYGLIFHNKDWFLIYPVASTLIISVAFIGILLICFLSTLLVLKRQKQMADLKNDFINNLAHELKTPIFASSVIFKIIREKLHKATYQDLEHHLSLLESENKQLKQKVEKVLELTVFERELFHANGQQINVHEIISQKVAIYSVLASANKGSISYQKQEPTAEIFADPVHIGNILDNLLDNAIRYSEEPPKIEIESFQDGGSLYIKIRDHGVGIEKKDLVYIFDKFFRVTKGNLHQTKGFGLGLSYVKMMTEAYGGKVSLESKAGDGSTFTLCFPAQNKSKREEYVT